MNQNKPTQTQKTILQQCNYEHLRTNKLLIIGIDTNTIQLKHTKKRTALDITYIEGKDHYDLTITKWDKEYNVTSEKIKGIYCDQLIPFINEFLGTTIPELNWIIKENENCDHQQIWDGVCADCNEKIELQEN